MLSEVLVESWLNVWEGNLSDLRWFRSTVVANVTQLLRVGVFHYERTLVHWQILAVTFWTLINAGKGAIMAQSAFAWWLIECCGLTSPVGSTNTHHISLMDCGEVRKVFRVALTSFDQLDVMQIWTTQRCKPVSRRLGNAICLAVLLTSRKDIDGRTWLVTTKQSSSHIRIRKATSGPVSLETIW